MMQRHLIQTIPGTLELLKTGEVYLISHDDLDGYGCSILAERYFGDRLKARLNVSYDNETGSPITKAIHQLTALMAASEKDALLLITDLSPRPEQMNLLFKRLTEIEQLNPGRKVAFLVFDHHDNPVARDLARHPNFLLEPDLCATRMLHLALQDILDPQGVGGQRERLDRFTEEVDALDRWQTSKPEFAEGRYLSDCLVRTPRLFSGEMSHLQGRIIESVIWSVFAMRQGAIEKPDIDIRFFMLVISALEDLEYSLGLQAEHGATMEMRVAAISEKLVESIEVEINGQRGRVYYDLPAPVYTYINDGVFARDEVAFTANARNNGGISLRARREGVDVSEISRQHFSGNGHVQASGGFVGSALKTSEAFKKRFKTFQAK